jgi:hypothetical protein
VKSKGCWKAAFIWQGKTPFVGYFKDKMEAARACDAAILSRPASWPG